MSDHSGSITFKCVKCEHPVVIDQSNPPEDMDVIKCLGCGHEFGTYAQVREAMIDAGKQEMDNIVGSIFGKKPKWK